MSCRSGHERMYLTVLNLHRIMQGNCHLCTPHSKRFRTEGLDVNLLLQIISQNWFSFSVSVITTCYIITLFQFLTAWCLSIQYQLHDLHIAICWTAYFLSMSLKSTVLCLSPCRKYNTYPLFKYLLFYSVIYKRIYMSVSKCRSKYETYFDTAQFT